MRWRNPFAMALLAIISTQAVLTAQEPTVQVNLIPPPPGLFSNVHAWSCRIANTESTYHGVWLHAEIYARRQNWNRVYWVDSRVFDLPVGTGTWRLRDLEPLRNQDYMTGYEVFFLRAGVVPADSYKYSLTLSTGGGDTGDIVINPMSPPWLRLPADGDTIREQYPQFAWFPVVPVPPGGVTYTLQVKEVLPGMTKEQAMASCPPWFEQRGITATQFQYTLSARSLRSGAPAYVLKGSGPDTTGPGWRGPWDYDVAEQPSEAGRIRGRVMDRAGEPMSVVGTELGAATDATGEYRVIKAPPGKHTLFAWQVIATTADGASAASEIRTFCSTQDQDSTDPVKVDLYPPPPNMLNIERLWHARLAVTGGPYTVYLRGVIMVESDTVLRGRSGLPPIAWTRS